jgi:hypothetical protein
MAATAKQSAQFVFEGKVSKAKGSNLKAAAGAGRTAVVAIERVVRAPEPLVGFAGQSVTVQLAEGEQVKQGERAVFYTNGWMFGENLAVQSVGHDPVQPQAAVAAASAITPAGRTLVHSAARAAAQDKIRERAAEAPVVISGKVIAVGLPGPAPAAAAAAGGPGRPTRISEHDPLWREAVVEVQQVHKGTAGKKQVVVRFPSSTDVRWHRAPKFQVGQEGVFSLHPDKVSAHAAPGAMAASFNPGASYTCLNVADFQPAHNEADAAVAIEASKT